MPMSTPLGEHRTRPLLSSARSWSYYQNGNCLCHGGSELPPDWLGENYYCDSGLRSGGESCRVGGPFESVGCTSAEECDTLGCSGEYNFKCGKWYSDVEATSVFGSDEGYLCFGSRYAQRDDFPDRPFGTFLYEVPGDEYSNDVIEARIMGGQSSGSRR